MAERLKVLLLEENDEVLKWFQTVLDNSRFECKIARNQEDFKNSITIQHVDIVILGLPIAGVSNGEAIQKLISFAPDLPIIILTEATSESEVLDCINKGAHGFIRKGLTGSSLINPIILQAFERQKALMSDRESQRILDNLISHLPGFIYRCRDDENWTTDYLSGGFEDLTGFQVDDFLSNRKNITNLIHPDDLKKTQAEIQKLRGKKKDFHLEYRIITADRKEKWVWEKGSFVTDKSGNQLMEGFVTDITDKKNREYQMQIMIKAGEILGNVNRPADFSRALMEKIMDLYKTGQTAILIPTLDDFHLKIVAATGKWRPIVEREIISVKKFPYSAVFSKKQIANIDVNKNLARVDADDQFMQQANCFLVLIPLETHDKKTGMIAVGRDYKFSQNDLNVIKTIAKMIATAIERANLYQKAEKHLAQLESLHVIDQAVTAVLDIKVVNKIILDQICKELEADAADILILNAPANTLEIIGTIGFYDNQIGKIQVPLTTSIAGKVLLENQDYVITNLDENPLPFIRKNMRIENFKAYFAKPLVLKGKAIGIVELFFRKPFTPDEDWKLFFEALATQTAVAYDSNRKYTELQKIQQNMASSLRSTFETWSKSLELHNIEMHGHIRRVTNETLQLAKIMGINDEELPNIERGALLHDIGKLAIMDDIIQKRGALTDEEWAEIKRAPEISKELLSNVKLLQDAMDIPYSHHENWDGSGYPQGLRGENIPLPARIFAVVETFDALTSPRPYRDAWSKKQAIEYLIDQKGRKFDPRVVDLFLGLQEE